MSWEPKAYILRCINKLYRKDPWLNNIYDAFGSLCSEADNKIDEVYGNNFFDTATEAGLQAFEAEAAIPTDTEAEREDREAYLRAKWLGVGKVGVELLQQVADEWRLGTTKISFTHGRWKTYTANTWAEVKEDPEEGTRFTWDVRGRLAYIHVSFIDPIGIPRDLANLQAALETYKPAHLPIYYTFLYQYWYQAHAKYTTWQATYDAGIWDKLREVE